MRDSHPLPPTDVIVDGRRVSLTRQGARGAPSVLMLHGFAGCAQLWREVSRDLARGHDVIVPDLLGCGRSERPPAGGYALEEQARLMLRLLDELQVGSATVCGHGLGGAVAVHMAALAPRRVAGLVLADAALHADAWPPPPALWLLTPGVGAATATALRLLPGLAARFVSACMDGPGHREALATPLQECLAPLREPGGSRSLRRYARSVDLGAAERDWDRVRVAPPPVLLLWGEEDRLLPLAYGRRLAAEAAGAAWVPVPDAGHLLPVERPERVAEEISGFLSDLPGAD